MPEHRNRHQHVAALADQPSKAAALGPQHQSGGNPEIHFIVGLLPVGGESDGPDAGISQVFERARDVDDVGDFHMRQRTCRRLAGRAAERRGVPRLPDDAVRPCRIHRPEDRAEVMRIFDPIEHNEECGRRRVADKIVELVGFALLHVGDHTLMRRAPGLAVEFVIADAADRDVRLLSLRDELEQAAVGPFACTQRHHAPRAQRFADGIDPVNQHARAGLYIIDGFRRERPIPKPVQLKTIIVLVMSTGALCCGHKSPVPPTPVPNPPTVSCPADIELVSHQGQPQPTANFDTPPAQDGELPVTVTCNPGSGTEFPNGRTTVTCEATDALARKGSCIFSVVVTPVPQLLKTTFMAFGDSLTEGKTSLLMRGAIVIPTRVPPVFNSPVGYVTQLYAKLTERYQDQTITIIAEGYGGRTTGDDKDREREVLDEWKPDALLLLEGTNDVFNFPDAAGIKSAAEALQRMVRDAKVRGARVFLGTLPPLNSHAPAAKFGANSEAALALLNERIKGIAAAEGVTLVDLFAVVPVTEIGNDGLHPTAAGYGLMADEWLKAIIETLEIKPPPAEAAPQSLSPARAHR
jgi:lysophospholipase L1-like esterase